jgi:hypothetical protein
MPKIDERIQSLEAKLKQLKVQHQRKEARVRTVAAKKSRHEELRRKILMGAVVLAKVEAGEIEEKIFEAVARSGCDAAGGSGVVWIGR